MSISYAGSTTKLDMRKFIALSMVAIFSFGAIADEPIATTIDGVEWRFRIDPDTQTAMLGQCTTPNPADFSTNEDYFACPSNIQINASSIPWIFDYGGTQYTVTRIGSSAFYNHRQFSDYPGFCQGSARLRFLSVYWLDGLARRQLRD